MSLHRDLLFWLLIWRPCPSIKRVCTSAGKYNPAHTHTRRTAYKSKQLQCIQGNGVCICVCRVTAQPCPTNLVKTPCPRNTNAAFINIIRSRACASVSVTTDSGRWITTSSHVSIHLTQHYLFKILREQKGVLWGHCCGFFGFTCLTQPFRGAIHFKSFWIPQHPNDD